jgi:hypothetical protein
MDEMDARLDGNAAAGLLQSIFPFEMTMARTICAGCDDRRLIAELAVYAHGMGTIIRCPQCDTALIRVVRTESRVWLDLRGTVSLELTES